MGIKDWIVTIFIFICALPTLLAPFYWLYVLYHKIRCRRVNDCRNRKCTYWSSCDHNEEARYEDRLELIAELRKQIDEYVRNHSEISRES